MRSVALPSGERVPALGMGTWHLGEDSATRAEEIETLRLGLDLGVTLIDTAEMYGEGRAEENLGALNYKLTPAQLAELDGLFPPPTRPQPLEML